MRIAVDTGGTFTDCVYLRDGKTHVLKVFSTPGNPADAIMGALRKISTEYPVPGTEQKQIPRGLKSARNDKTNSLGRWPEGQLYPKLTLSENRL
jgi:hypothetical protein